MIRASPVPPSPEPPKADLDAYIRRNLVVALFVVLGLVMALGAIGVFCEAELFAFTQTIYERIGLSGLMIILFISDFLSAPFPPDLILVVIAKSALREHWLEVLLLMGTMSSAAGNVGWLIGSKMGDAGFAGKLFGRFSARHTRVVERYGWVGVALGALTPIPFSVTCWAAGLFKMRFSSVVWPTFLRFPRFFLYYLFITYSDEVVRFFI